MISSDDTAADDTVILIVKDGGLAGCGSFYGLVKDYFDELVFRS